MDGSTAAKNRFPFLSEVDSKIIQVPSLICPPPVNWQTTHCIEMALLMKDPLIQSGAAEASCF